MAAKKKPSGYLTNCEVLEAYAEVGLFDPKLKRIWLKEPTAKARQILKNELTSNIELMVHNIMMRLRHKKDWERFLHHTIRVTTTFTLAVHKDRLVRRGGLCYGE